jgi:hypothetical protein
MTAFIDKLTILNDCLIATGNNTVTVEDGSAEWIVGSNAYDRAVAVVMSKHNWGFDTALEALSRVGDSTYPGYADVFEKPNDCLQIENVWATDQAANVPQFSGFDASGEGARPPELDYRIIGDQIHTVAPNGATALYVKMPGATIPAREPFMEALRRLMESYIFQGLNEDFQAAAAALKVSSAELADARQKSDSESPRRVPFRSNYMDARRRRRSGWWL